jgi:hypothetical protein
VIEQIKVNCEQAKEDAGTTAEDAMVGFLNANIANTLVVPSSTAITHGSVGTSVSMARLRELQVRVETDLELVWVSRAHFRQHCGKMRFNYRHTIRDLKKDGVVIAAEPETKKTLGRGTQYETGQVRCILVDLKKISAHIDFTPAEHRLTT